MACFQGITDGNGRVLIALSGGLFRYFRGLKFNAGSSDVVVVEDNGSTPITDHGQGLAFIDGALLVDSGSIGTVHVSAGLKVNERGAVYIATDGTIDHYKDGVGFSAAGALVTGPIIIED